MTSLALRKSDFTVIPPTAFILRSRPLREHIELATTSRFSDDIWTLTCGRTPGPQAPNIPAFPRRSHTVPSDG